MRWISLTCLVLVPPAAVAGGVPDYGAFELQARSNIVDGFNLPAGSSFNSGTPAINADARVAFRLIVVGGTGASGIWTGGHGVGEVVYAASSDLLVEDPSINTHGQVAFEQFDVFTDGVYVYDPVTRGTTQVVAPGGPFGINAVTRAQINDAGRLGFRAAGNGGNHYIGVDGPSQTSYVAESTSPYGFLFTASYNNADQLAGKVRVGGTAGSLPDEIRIFEADGSSVLRAVDDDGDPGSPFTGFDNSIDLNDDGVVAFIANRVGGGRGVYRADANGVTEIATTDDAILSDVAFFPPAINNSGVVAFRGLDASGLDAVFVGDGATLIRLVGEHDLLPSDLGEARIDQHDGSITFGGAVDINDHGDVVFHCTLTPADNNQIEWGSGIYVAYAARVEPGDVDGDGDVDFADLLEVLAAWGQSGVSADVDASGVVDFNDLLIVLANWTLG